MVFGVDLHFDHVMSTSELILAGISRDKFFLVEYITEWINRSRLEALDRDVEVITLSKGWFMVSFKNVEMLEWVLSRQ